MDVSYRKKHNRAGTAESCYSLHSSTQVLPWALLVTNTGSHVRAPALLITLTTFNNCEKCRHMQTLSLAMLHQLLSLLKHQHFISNLTCLLPKP